MFSPSLLAQPGKRRWAAFFDLGVVALSTLAMNAIVESSGRQLPGVPLLAFVHLVYHTGCLSLREGRTLGKGAIDICVVSQDGQPVSFAQSLLRASVRSLPILALDPTVNRKFLWLLDRSPESAIDAIHVSLPIASIVFAVVEFWMVLRPPARQTVADLVAHTLVVNLPPLQPHRAPAAPMYSASDREFGLPPRPPNEGGRPPSGGGRAID